MKNIFIPIMIAISSLANAQSISVGEFYLDEKDITPIQQGSIVLDQNGEKCALIKIITTETNFNFDVGTLGVQKTLPRTSETWVYVPFGVKRITISHPELGQLRDYIFPVPIEKARTYVMKLIITKANQYPDINGAKTPFEAATAYYEEESYNPAFRILEELASQDDPNAISALGVCYAEGRGVEQSYAKAAELFIKASRLGSVEAQFSLAFCYLRGKGVAQNEEKAIQLFEEVSNQGYNEAKLILAILYVTYDKNDFAKAVNILKTLSNISEENAEKQMGVFVYNAEGVQWELSQAKDIFAEKAKEGDVDAKEIYDKYFNMSSGEE